MHSFRLIAPTLNLTYPEGEDSDSDLDSLSSVDLLGFSGIVGDLEKLDANKNKPIPPAGYDKNTQTSGREIFHLNNFNVIGEDYVAGVGNIGSIHDLDDFETDTDDGRRGEDNDGDDYDQRLGKGKVAVDGQGGPKKDNDYGYELYGYSTVPPPNLRHHHNSHSRNNWKTDHEDDSEAPKNIFDLIPSMLVPTIALASVLRYK